MLKAFTAVVAALFFGIVAIKVFDLPIPYLNESNSQSAAQVELTELIPADSVFYVYGNNTIFATQANQMDQMFNSIETSLASNPELLDQFADVLEKLRPIINSATYTDGVNQFSIAQTGKFAFYVDGMIPMLKLNVNDGAVFTTQLTNTLAEFDVVASEQTVNDFTFYQVDLEQGLTLVYGANNSVATVSVVYEQFQKDFITRIFANEKPAASLVTGGVIAQDDTTYQLTNDYRFVVNFAEIFAAITDAKANGLNADLNKFIPLSAMLLAEVQQPQCQAEIMAIANGMPRLVLGTQKYTIDSDVISSDMVAVLEIKNAKILSTLKQLNGHLNSTLHANTDAMLSFGLGLDVSRAMTTVDTLLAMVQDKSFECESLQSAQFATQMVDSSMLGMATMMAQGVRGIDLSIIDAQFEDAITPQLSSLSAVVSLALDDPDTLLPMMQSIPGVAFSKPVAKGEVSQVILPPTDGFDVDVFATANDNHIIFYTGKGKDYAKKLDTELLNYKGLMSMAFNYSKFASMIKKMAPLAMMTGQMQCEDMNSSFAAIMQSEGSGQFTTGFTANGFEINISSSTKFTDQTFDFCNM